MPKIIKNSAQENALAEIEKALANIKEINEIILAGYSGQMDVIVNPAEGRRCKAKVLPEFRYQVMLALAREKKSLSKKLLAKTKKYHIELSELELNDLNELAVPKDRSSEHISLDDDESTEAVAVEEEDEIVQDDVDEEADPIIEGF